MKVEAHLTDILSSITTLREIEVSDSTTIRTLFQALDVGKCYVDLSRYYVINDPYFMISRTNAELLPYVVVNNKVHGNADYAETLLTDFFATHNIETSEIYVDYIPPQPFGAGGGADGPLVGILEMWRQFYAILETIDPIVGVGGAAFAGAKYLARKLQERNLPRELTDISPASVFSFVLQRQHWNPFDLADLLQISEEDAKNLLKLCRYKWNPQKLMYVQSPQSAAVISKLNEARWVRS